MKEDGQRQNRLKMVDFCFFCLSDNNNNNDDDDDDKE